MIYRNLSVTLAAVLLLSWTNITTNAGETTERDEAVLRHFKTVLWPQAYREQDVALLDRLLHDRFQMIDDEGNRSTKARELEYVSNNRWDPGSFTYEIERLEIFEGRFAVVDGTGIAERYTYKSSNYLLKEDGQWRAIGSHVSGVKDRTQTQ